jgi:arylsulfatase A-like enzyme
LDAGRAIDAPVTSVDFFPTLVELAGLPAAASTDGVSLVPVRRGDLDRRRGRRLIPGGRRGEVAAGSR